MWTGSLMHWHVALAQSHYKLICIPGIIAVVWFKSSPLPCSSATFDVGETHGTCWLTPESVSACIRSVAALESVPNPLDFALFPNANWHCLFLPWLHFWNDLSAVLKCSPSCFSCALALPLPEQHSHTTTSAAPPAACKPHISNSQRFPNSITLN